MNSGSMQQRLQTSPDILIADRLRTGQRAGIPAKIGKMLDDLMFETGGLAGFGGLRPGRLRCTVWQTDPLRRANRPVKPGHESPWSNA